jgi:predicted nuclease of predicted toxin-antitoxin system
VSALAFLVDECLPVDVTHAIRERNFDAADIVERNLRGIDDRAVWVLAASENRILVTRDLDFPLRDVLPRPAGLVLIRSPGDSTAGQLGALAGDLLDSVVPSQLLGRITVVSPGRYRQRDW